MRNFNKNSSTIRWGIIGCGNVTELKSGPACRLTEKFELTAAHTSWVMDKILGKI